MKLSSNRVETRDSHMAIFFYTKAKKVSFVESVRVELAA